MSAVTFTYRCANCDREFNAPGVRDFSYGDFVMRSEWSDHAVFLEALTDPAFLESYEILKGSPSTAQLSAEQKGRLQQKIFGELCDRDPEGHVLRIGLSPRCPSCASRNMASWIENVPDETWPLPLVKHETWRVLSKQQKVDAVEIAIRREMDKI